VDAGPQRVPDVLAHDAAVQAGPEQLSCRRVQARQVQTEAAYRATADLHRGEVAIVHDRRVSELVDGCGPAVDLEAKDLHIPSRYWPARR